MDADIPVFLYSRPGYDYIEHLKYQPKNGEQPMNNYDDYIVVLNDGETYTSMEGCRVVRIPDTVDIHAQDYIIKDAVSRGAGISVAVLYESAVAEDEDITFSGTQEEYDERTWGNIKMLGPEYLQLWEEDDE